LPDLLTIHLQGVVEPLTAFLYELGFTAEQGNNTIMYCQSQEKYNNTINTDVPELCNAWGWACAITH